MKLNTVCEEMMEATLIHEQYRKTNSQAQWFGVCFEL